MKSKSHRLGMFDVFLNNTFCFDDIQKGMHKTHPDKSLLVRGLKNLIHRIFYGWDSSELWALNASITLYILPRLKAFREYAPGTPGNLTKEEWYKILDTMIYAFESLANGHDLTHPSNEKLPFEVGAKKNEAHRKKIAKGLRYFSDYYRTLWC